MQFQLPSFKLNYFVQNLVAVYTCRMGIGLGLSLVLWLVQTLHSVCRGVYVPTGAKSRLVYVGLMVVREIGTESIPKIPYKHVVLGGGIRINARTLPHVA